MKKIFLLPLALILAFGVALNAQTSEVNLALKEVKTIMFNKQDSKKLVQMGIENDAIYATVGGSGAVQYFQVKIAGTGVVAVNVVPNPNPSQKSKSQAAATAVTSADKKAYGFAFTAKNGKQLFVAVNKIVPSGRDAGVYTAELDFQGGNTVRKKLGHINKAPKK